MKVFRVYSILDGGFAGEVVWDEDDLLTVITNLNRNGVYYVIIH
jgi:hypothetical protein